MRDKDVNKDNQTKLFLNLLMANQRQISSYINVLVPDFSDADDLLQQTITVMWEKFDQYQPETNFAAWGVRIAYYNILRYRREHVKKSMQISNSVFQSLSEVMEHKCRSTNETLFALRTCIPKLSSADKSLLHLRYHMNQSVNAIAVQNERSVQFVYRALARVHQVLGRCIHLTLAENGSL